MVRLGLGMAALLLVGTPALAAEEWKADGPTCQGAYDALNKQQSSLMTLWAEARATPNFDKINFDARASAPELEKAIPDYQRGDWEMYSQNFEMMLLKGSIDSDPKPIRTVLDVAARCDAKFGFKPALSLATAAAPKPVPPTPKPAPPAPAAKPPPVAKPALPVVTDKVCAVSYLALSYGNQANPKLAQALLQRADGAGGRHLAANPGTNQQAFVTETQTAAEARVKAILIDKKAPAEPLFAEVVACDARYGLPPPPQ